MKKLSIMILCIILTVMLVGCNNEFNEKPTNSLVPESSCFDPSFESEKEFVDYVNENKDVLKRNGGEDTNEVAQFDYYYRYVNTPNELDKIEFSNFSVVSETALDEKELISSEKFMTFIWYRYSDGVTLLQNSISQNPHLFNKVEGEENVYVCDKIGGKEYHFMKDGYLFYVYLPIEYHNELIADGKDIFAVEKVLIP